METLKEKELKMKFKFVTIFL